MNDQWSGNTLASAVWTNLAPPVRASSQRASRATSRRLDRLRRRGGFTVTDSAATVPEPWSDGIGEVTGGDDGALVVDRQRQLGERAGRGSEDRLGPLEDVERRLVARAQQQRGLRLVEADRAPGVGAQLGVG